MKNEVSEINWEEIMVKFSSLEGTIANFCKENKLNQHQLYYQRKKLEKENKTTFHAIDLNKEETINPANIDNLIIAAKDIKIEIGKANIYIPANEIALLADIIKELAKSC